MRKCEESRTFSQKVEYTIVNMYLLVIDMNSNEIDFEVIQRDLKHRMYQYIGSGSSRSVFDLANGYVVKAAINHGGLTQNQMEYNVYNQEKTVFFAPILAISDNSMFLIMKKGERLWNINQVSQYYNVYNIRELVDNTYFIMIRKTYGLAAGDLVRKSSWGMIDQVPVLVDYGYTGRRRGRR